MPAPYRIISNGTVFKAQEKIGFLRFRWWVNISIGAKYWTRKDAQEIIDEHEARIQHDKLVNFNVWRIV